MGTIASLIAAKQDWERRQAGLRVLQPNDPIELQRAAARRNFLEFCCYTFPGFQTNWHHRKICELVDQVLRGDLPRLMLCMPPRYGKSELLSRRLPSYLMGRNPDAQIIATSYSADLASRMNRDVQRIIESPAYRELFPNTALFGKNIRSVAGGSYLRNSEIFEIVDHLGSYRSAGVNGGITGMGFGRLLDPDMIRAEDYTISGLGLIDDPFKNRKEAESITIQEGVWDWYTSTFRTRCEGDAGILVVNTRWNKRDLAGRLIQLAKDDPKADQWVVIEFEAIRGEDDREYDPRQPGEPLWVRKHTLEDLLGIKASLGAYDWSSLYQQSPTPDQAAIFQRGWISYWQELPAMERVVISVFSHFQEATSAGQVCIQVWGKSGDRHYLLEQFRDRLGYLETRDTILEMIEDWQGRGINISELLIEGKRNGRTIINSLAASCPITVTETQFKGDTEVGRAQAIAGMLQAGDVLIPIDAPWVQKFLEEIAEFPGSDTVNQVCAMAQALIYLSLRAQSGQVFEFFNRSVHTLRGEEENDFSLDPNIDLHLSFDFNRSPATCVVGQLRGDDLFILREFYLLESNTFELSEAVCKWVLSTRHRAKIFIYGDASGQKHTSNSTDSDWEIIWDAIKSNGLKSRTLKRYGRSNPSVRDTVISCNALLKAERIFIMLSQCPELIADLEQLKWKGDDIDKSDLKRSHLCDGFRYLCHTLFPYRQQARKPERRQQRAIAGIAG